MNENKSNEVSLLLGLLFCLFLIWAGLEKLNQENQKLEAENNFLKGQKTEIDKQNEYYQGKDARDAYYVK